MKLEASPPTGNRALVSSHRNDERELITIERMRDDHPLFPNALILCIYDDDTPTVAPTLLDAGTVEWLKEQLA